MTTYKKSRISPSSSYGGEILQMLMGMVVAIYCDLGLIILECR